MVMHSPLFPLLVALANVLAAIDLQESSIQVVVGLFMIIWTDVFLPLRTHSTSWWDQQLDPVWMHIYIGLLVHCIFIGWYLFFIHPSQVSSFLLFLILNALKILFTGSGMVLTSIIQGSMKWLCLDHMIHQATTHISYHLRYSPY